MFQLEAEVREKKGSKTLEDAARAPTLMTNAEDAAQEDAQAGSGSAAAVASSAAAPSDTAAKEREDKKKDGKARKAKASKEKEKSASSKAQPSLADYMSKQDKKEEKGEGRKEEAARVRRV